MTYKNHLAMTYKLPNQAEPPCPLHSTEGEQVEAVRHHQIISFHQGHSHVEPRAHLTQPGKTTTKRQGEQSP